MYSFSSDTKFLIITDGVEVWKLEKNQVSLKTANELVIIDRNGMHYKNFAYTEVAGGYANAAAVVAYLETLVNTGQTVSIDTSLLATKANQTNGDQLTKITDGAGVVNTKLINTQLTGNDVALVTNTVIHAYTSSGGGQYVDIKAEPSGKLLVKDDDVITELQTLNSLVPSKYDYISLGYTGTNLTTVVFKTGGSGGTTVSTLTLAYTGSRLDSVTKT